jgi:hypothetical protein
MMKNKRIKNGVSKSKPAEKEIEKNHKAIF